jgi:PAS domain S-box-containing protein
LGLSTFPNFLKSDSEVGNLIARFDWSRTALGPIDGWPQPVKTVVSAILHSPLPIVTLWREPGVMIYNDAYSVFAGGRHPVLLGSNVREGWPEVADFNDNVMRVVLSGKTLSYEDQALTLLRSGTAERVWMNLDYSPVLDESGTPVGVIAIVVETTAKVKAQQWLMGERDRLRSMFEQAPGFVAMMHGPDHVFELTNPAFLQLVGHRDLLGKPVREALPDIQGQGFYELLDGVFTTAVPFSGTALPVKLQREPDKDPEDRFVDLVYQPIRDADGVVTGIFAQGTDVTERVVAERALAESERRHRQIVDSAFDYGIIALDIYGKVIRWNEGARRIFGWDEEEMLGNDVSRIFTPEDRAEGRASYEMDTALERGVVPDERWHLRKDASRFWASGEMSPIRDGKGEAVGFVKVLRDRTAEHLAGEALKRSESQLRRAQEAGGVGLFSVDVTDNMITATPQFFRIFGIEARDRVPAHVIENIVVPEDRALASSPASRSTMSAAPNVEYQIRRASDGARRIIARRAEFETDADGKPLRLVGVVQDITERRAAQRAARDSEARFRALAQALPNQMWTARADGMLDWFNQRVYDFSGATAGELDGEAWTRLVHPDDLAAAAERWKTAVAEASTYEIEFRLRRHDGVYRWFIARAVAALDDDGAVSRWIGTNTDIDELRKTREELWRLNATLEERVSQQTADRDRMWRLATDVMIVTDLTGMVMAANPAWETILGWREAELVGRNARELIHPDDLDLVELTPVTERVLRVESRVLARDGSFRIISWTAVPDGGFVHAVGRDITAERDAERALKASEAALQQAQKMEAIGNLTGGVAHDFNNLLQVVSGNLQLLRKYVIDNEQARTRVESALAGVERGAKLANQLLAFGRRQALDPRSVNVGRLIAGMDEMLRRTLGEETEIETIVGTDLWNTLADPSQLENALLNLAINARDAMDGAGKLTIEVANTRLDEAYARANSDAAPGDYVVLSVTDTGTGMPPEIIAQVFEPFFSTKPEGRGTGLGLSMVYGFTRQSGGHVKVYSEVGHGTTIRLYLPRSQGVEDTILPLSDQPVVGGNETVLVVEDDEAVRATVVEMLADLGYRVLKAGEAQTAMTVLESGVHVDLLFTDVVMPGPMKSTQLAHKARERLPDLAVLYTSGYTENSIVHGGRLDPGVQLISKPYAREALARKIRHVLANQAQANQARRASEAAAAPAPVSDALSILLVEDDVLIRMNTSDMLSELGHRVTEAGSGEEAIRMADTQAFDAVVTDLGLPGMSGQDLCAWLARSRPGIGIIVASGEHRLPPMPGVDAVLVRKPYSQEDLAQALEAWKGGTTG